MVQFSTKVVGTGIRPQARTNNASANKNLDDTFDIWAKQTGYYAQQGLAVRTIVESGEAVLRTRARRPEDGLIVPLWPQLLEPDYIDHRKTQTVEGGGYIIQGIEFDQLDREVAVWMFPSHPGDSINTAWWRRVSMASYRVPLEKTGKGTETIVRGFRQDRAGQVRGITWFTPVMTSMWEQASYDDAERIRKRTEACLALLVTSPDPADGVPALGNQRANGAGDQVEEMRPGMVARFRSGETVTTLEPKAAGGYGEYMRRQDRQNAVGLGLLYEILTGDLSQINYSSYRGGLIGLRDFIETIQYNVLIPFICDPVWMRFVNACRIAGIVPDKTGYEVEWSPPAFDLLDREAEAKADVIEVRAGTSTWPQVVARKGYDPQKQLDEIQKWNADVDQRGIILETDPRKIGRNGAMQLNPPEEVPAPDKEA